MSFIGTYDHVSIANDDDYTKLFVGSGNSIYWPDKTMTINPMRAYFQLNGISGDNGNSIIIKFELINKQLTMVSSGKIITQTA